MREEALPGEPGSLHSPVHHQGKARHHDPADADGSPDAPRCLRVSRFTVYGMLCLHCKEAPRMASVRCSEVQARPTALLDVTRVTLDEFPQQLPPLEAAFQAHRAA